jgi:hypothetical protein
LQPRPNIIIDLKLTLNGRVSHVGKLVNDDQENGVELASKPHSKYRILRLSETTI